MVGIRCEKTGKRERQRLHRELFNTEAVMKATRKATWIHATYCATFHQAEKTVDEFTNACRY